VSTAGAVTERPESGRFDITTPWDAGDEGWLEACLRMARHFDDNPANPHDPVECQRRLPTGQPRAEWKLLREEAGLTLRQLARRLDVDQASVSRWESGQRWPNSADYAAWLREAGERHAENARLRAFNAHSKRDGWLGPERLIGQNPDSLQAHWQAMYKRGGLFDRWVETGSLPSWTPRDAGLAD